MEKYHEVCKQQQENNGEPVRGSWNHVREGCVTRGLEECKKQPKSLVVKGTIQIKVLRGFAGHLFPLEDKVKEDP
jgi:hypothetical protein